MPVANHPGKQPLKETHEIKKEGGAESHLDTAPLRYNISLSNRPISPSPQLLS